MLRGFNLLVLEYCSAVWCSAADVHIKLMDRVVRGASIVNECAFEWNITHRRSVAVFCMLHKVRSHPTHPFHGALPVPLLVTSGALVAHWYAHAPLRCRTSQYRGNFIPLSVSAEQSWWPCMWWCETYMF